MNKILFVGGPEDGYRKADTRYLPNQSILFTRQYPDLTNCNYDLNSPITFQATEYKVKQFKGDNGKIYEVAFDSSVQDCMGALIKGYRGHRNKRRPRKYYPGDRFYNP